MTTTTPAPAATTSPGGELTFGDQGQGVLAEQAEAVIRLHGLPFNATEQDVLEFLRPLKVRGDAAGVHFCTDARSRRSGEAFVAMATPSDAEQALLRNRQVMG
jgi:hypothetical protein